MSYTRTIRATGESLTVARAAEIGADPEAGKWVTRCNDHEQLAYSATEQAAYYLHGLAFCTGCQEGNPAPTRNAEPAKKPTRKTAAR
jgi:hypothetical protein